MTKKYTSNGTHYIEQTGKEKWSNNIYAMIAFQNAQYALALQGYLTTSTIDTENKRIELTIHIQGKGMPKEMDRIDWTNKEISSHTYYNKYLNEVKRIRCITYKFEYE